MKKYIVKHYNPNYNDHGETKVEANTEDEAYDKFLEIRPYEVPTEAIEQYE